MHNICDLSTVRVYLGILECPTILSILRKVRIVDPGKFDPGTNLLRNQGKTRRNRKTRNTREQVYLLFTRPYKGARRHDVTRIEKSIKGI